MALLRTGWLCEKNMEPRGQTQDTVEPDSDCSCPKCAVSISDSIDEAAVILLFPVVSLKCWANDPVGIGYTCRGLAGKEGPLSPC